MTTSDSVASQLCLKCGLCCNGALFKDVVLQPGDAERWQSLGLPIALRPGVRRLTQPCAALDGCRCTIYAGRPTRCREFECLLFKAVLRGEVTQGKALAVIRSARARVQRVGSLLRGLGDTDERVALSVRFRRLKKRFETGSPDKSTAAKFADLSLAVHDLNVILSQEFFSGPID